MGPLLIATIAIVQAPRPARESRRFHGYASGLLSRHPANGAEYHRVADRLGGQTWVIGGGAGGFLTASIGLEGEVVYGGTVSAPQRFSYTFSEEYTAVNRDLLLNELVRYRPGGGSAIQWVAGGGYARTSAEHRDVIQIDANGSRRPITGTRLETYNGLTITGGLDVVVTPDTPVSIAPSVRVRWLHRPSGGYPGWNGIGTLAFQFGVSVFFR